MFSWATSPVILKVLKTSGCKAQMLLPNFWPTDVYKKKFKKEFLEVDLEDYEYKGVTYKGCYLDGGEFPPISGCILMSTHEKSEGVKEQEVGNSAVGQKGHVEKLWGQVEAATNSRATATANEDGAVKHSIAKPTRTLKRLFSDESV